MSNIVALWQNLLDYDKQRVVFAARHQSRLDTGRFRSPKKRQEFTPGVESVKRHALTTTAPLAQWPDCCRLIETIFVSSVPSIRVLRRRDWHSLQMGPHLGGLQKNQAAHSGQCCCYAADHPAAGGCEPHHTGSVA